MYFLISGCTPSPADYNVNALNRTGGAVIPQSERFAVPQSPALSETSSFVSQGSTGTPSSKIVSFFVYFVEITQLI